MSLRSLLEWDARLSETMRVAEKPGALRSLAVFFAHSGDSWFWGMALLLLWLVSDPAWRRWEMVELFGISVLVVVVIVSLVLAGFDWVIALLVEQLLSTDSWLNNLFD